MLTLLSLALYHVYPSLAFSPLVISYTLEILPYHIRSKGFNIFHFSVSLSLVFNQYINPIALGMCFRNHVASLAYLFLPS